MSNPIPEETWGQLRKNWLEEYKNNSKIDFIEAKLDEYWEKWEAGEFDDINQFVGSIEQDLNRLRMFNSPTGKNYDYIDMGRWNELMEQWRSLVNQIVLDGSVYDELLIDKITWVETDMTLMVQNRFKANLEISQEMKDFKGIVHHWENTFSKVIEEALPEEIPSNAPEVDEIIDHPTQLYMLADDLRFEYDRNGHPWATSYMDVFRWAEHKYTYQGGKKVKAKALVSAYYKAKANSKV